MQLTDKIYVAGHTGLVGSAIARKLQALGFTNLILHTHAKLDLTNQAAVNQFFAKEKPSYVFLAAAKVGGILANNRYRGDFIYQNLQIQNNVIHASYLNQVQKLLFLGSSCIYPKNSAQPIKEEYLLTNELEYTNEPYAIAKIAGIKLCESYNLQYGTNYLAVMPTNLYGPQDNFDLESAHVLPAIIRKVYLAKLLTENNFAAIAHNLEFNGSESELRQHLLNYGISQTNNQTILTLWGSGKPYREFLYVDDMADACVFVMQQLEFKDLSANLNPVRNTHLNIGTGSDITINELANLIQKQFGFTGIIQFDATKPDGTMRKLQDVSRLTKLGWRYQIELITGLNKTINWYMQRCANVKK